MSGLVPPPLQADPTPTLSGLRPPFPSEDSHVHNPATVPPPTSSGPSSQPPSFIHPPTSPPSPLPFNRTDLDSTPAILGTLDRVHRSTSSTLDAHPKYTSDPTSQELPTFFNERDSIDEPRPLPSEDTSPSSPTQIYPASPATLDFFYDPSAAAVGRDLLSPTVTGYRTSRHTARVSARDPATMDSWDEELDSSMNYSCQAEGPTPDPHTQTRRKNPPRLDLSRLFSRRKGSQTSEPTPPKTSSKYSNSPYTSSAQSTPFWPARNAQPSSQGPPTARHLTCRSPPADAMSPKINVRRPPQGIKHWFDGVGEDPPDVDYFSVPRPSLEEPQELDASEVEDAGARSERPRHTFLSISSSRTARASDKPNQNSIAQPQYDESTRATDVPHTWRSISDGAVQSHSSSSTERQYPLTATSTRSQSLPEKAMPSAPRPAARHHVAGQDASFQGHSVLVLSDPDDSDDPLDDGTVNYSRYNSLGGLTSDGVICDAKMANVYSVQPPHAVRPVGHAHRAATSITDGSQPSSESTFDHSSLSDLSQDISSEDPSDHTPWLSSPTMSIRSKSPAASSCYDDDDLPSRRTYHDSYSQQPQDYNPEHAQRKSYKTISMHQTEISGRATPPMERIARAFRDNPTRTHKLMAVTSEEAEMLASMRRQRASMERRFLPTADEDTATATPVLQNPDHNRPPWVPRSLDRNSYSRPTSLALSNVPRESTVFTDVSDPLPPSDTASAAALLSPDLNDYYSRPHRRTRTRTTNPRDSTRTSILHALPQARQTPYAQLRHYTSQYELESRAKQSNPPSIETVSKVWEDVQAWRRRGRSDDATEREDVRRTQIHLGAAAELENGAEKVMDMPPLTAPLPLRPRKTPWADDHDQTGDAIGEDMSGGRSLSAGNALTGTNITKAAGGGDVKSELLAAWKDLGGGRRESGFSGLGTAAVGL